MGKKAPLGSGKADHLLRMEIRTKWIGHHPFFTVDGLIVGYTSTIRGDGAYDGTYREKTFHWVEQNGHRQAHSRGEINTIIAATRPTDALGLANYFNFRPRLGRLATSDCGLVDYVAMTGCSDIDPMIEDRTLRFTVLQVPDIIASFPAPRIWRCVHYRFSLESCSMVSKTELWSGIPDPSL